MQSGGARSRAYDTGPNDNRRLRGAPNINDLASIVARSNSNFGQNQVFNEQVRNDQQRIDAMISQIQQQRAANPPAQNFLYSNLPEYQPGDKRDRSERKAFVERMMNEGIFDIDGDGIIQAATDGKLINGYLHGHSKNKLAKRIGTNAEYDIDKVMARLDQLKTSGVLDTDNDGKIEKSDGSKAYYWIKRLD